MLRNTPALWCPAPEPPQTSWRNCNVAKVQFQVVHFAIQCATHADTAPQYCCAWAQRGQARSHALPHLLGKAGDLLSDDSGLDETGFRTTAANLAGGSVSSLQITLAGISLRQLQYALN